MSLSPSLLYTLLVLWLLPAAALVGAYCCILLREVRHRRRRQKSGALRRLFDPTIHASRRSFTDLPATVREHSTSFPFSHFAQCAAAGPHVRVPLVIEDEEGDLCLRHGRVCLN